MVIHKQLSFGARMDGTEQSRAAEFKMGGRNDPSDRSLLDLNKGVDFRTGGVEFRTAEDFRTGGGGASTARDFRGSDSHNRSRPGLSIARSASTMGGSVINRYSDAASGRTDGPTKAKAKTFTLPKPKVKITRNQIKLRDYQIEELGKAFDIFDDTGEGKMNIKDIKTVIRACGFEPKKDEIKTIMKECDPNGKGYLTKDDFIKLFMLKLTQKDPREEIERAFKFFDKNNKSYITFQDLKMCANEIGEDLHDEEIQEMMDEADLNNDGAVDLEEFIKMMTKTYYFE